MKKCILFVVFVLSLSVFVSSCQKKVGGFSKSDLLGTWHDHLEVFFYTFYEDGSGDCLEPVGSSTLKWNVQNDSLFVDFYEGGSLLEYHRWAYAIDSLVNGEHHGKKNRRLYLSDGNKLYQEEE